MLKISFWSAALGRRLGAYSRSLSLLATNDAGDSASHQRLAFYSEGVEKYQSVLGTQSHSLRNAKGPFRRTLPRVGLDHDGQIRLDYQKTKEGMEPTEAMKLHLAGFRDRVVAHYGFDKSQTGKAQANYARRSSSFLTHTPIT